MRWVRDGECGEEGSADLSGGECWGVGGVGSEADLFLLLSLNKGGDWLRCARTPLPNKDRRRKKNG